jgi:hypothetical protein
MYQCSQRLLVALLNFILLILNCCWLHVRFYVYTVQCNIIIFFSELEESLLVLSFSYVIDMLKVLEVFIDSGWEIELSCRCLFFLLRYIILYYTLRFYFPYWSLLVQPVTIFVYGPARYLHYFREKYNIANSSCRFGPYNIFLVTDRSIYCHMTLSAMNYLLSIGVIYSGI